MDPNMTTQGLATGISFVAILANKVVLLIGFN
jgi:hypothetical protein